MQLLASVAIACFVAPATECFLQPSSQSSTRRMSSSKAPRASSLCAGPLDDFFSKATTLVTSAGGPKVEAPPDFQIPEPKPLAVTRSSDIPSLLRSTLGLALRLGAGTFVLGWKVDDMFAPDEDGKYRLQLGPLNIRDSSTVLGEAPRPNKPLILYEYDGSPFCKRVRETMNILDLTVEYRPCPGAREGFSDELFEKTGRRTVPFLVDPNTGVEIFESADQIDYLLDTYGPQDAEVYDRKAMWPVTAEQFAVTTAGLTAVLRDMPASRPQADARPDNQKMKPLEIWGYESSPFVRPVREKLCALCLPHRMVSCCRGSANRDKLVERTGRFQVPYLVDPNTGVEMFEAPEIVDYLEAVYTMK